jgi:C4-type Zn-finger protein
MKQTAVEWLENQIKTSKYFYKVIEDIQSRSTVAQSNIFEQAKEMEKEQRLNQNKTELNDALREFQKKYPSVTSGDLQTFILGWQAAQSNPI